MRPVRALPGPLLCLLLAPALAMAAPREQAAHPPAHDDTRSAQAFAFEEATIAQLQAPMRAGTLDSATLTRAYLDRIAAIDAAGPTLRAAIELNPDALREAGADVRNATLAIANQWGEAELEVLLYEFKDGLNRYLQDSGAPVASLEALIAFNTAHAEREMPWFGQELLQAEAKSPLTDRAYLEARAKARRMARTEGIDATLRDGGFDALVAPATSPAWPIDLVNSDHFTGTAYGVAAVAGTPTTLIVTMGDVAGLPVGIVFMGPAWSEARLIGLGYDFDHNATLLYTVVASNSGPDAADGALLTDPAPAGMSQTNKTDKLRRQTTATNKDTHYSPA